MAFAGDHLIAFWGHFTSISKEDITFISIMTDLRQDCLLRKFPKFEYRRNSSVWHVQWLLRALTHQPQAGLVFPACVKLV